MIEFTHISKSWEEQVVLEDITFSIPEGGCFCILGKSGSGKSVMARLLLGLETPDKGSIHIDNIHITDFNNKSQWSKILLQFGMVFQHSALFPSLTVFENIALQLIENKQVSHDEIEARVKAILPKVGLLPNILTELPHTLSGGMKKRVAIARALLHRPRYIIYDEPTTGLDPINCQLIDTFIADIANNKETTSIIITHDLETVRYLRANVALLHEKKIYFVGSSTDFFASTDEVIRSFLARSR